MDCGVCFMKFNLSKTQPYVLYPCSHTFCLDCLKKLKENNCPNCRSEISDQTPYWSFLTMINDTKANNLNDFTEAKLNDNQEKMNHLKYQINKKYNDLIKRLQDDRKLLLGQVSAIEKGLNQKLNELKNENLTYFLDKKKNKREFVEIKKFSLEYKFKPTEKNTNLNLLGEITNFQNMSESVECFDASIRLSSSTSTCPAKLNIVSENYSSPETTLVSSASSISKAEFVLNAFVNGFAQLKLSANKIDHEYIIEVYWSRGNRTFVKRTFYDFVNFHRSLLESFSEFFNEMNSSHNHWNNRCFYNRNPKSFSHQFIKNSEENFFLAFSAHQSCFSLTQLKLAESREIQLNSYVQQILNLPTQISHSEIVSRFFESWATDPKPSLYEMNSNNLFNNQCFDKLDEEEIYDSPANTEDSSTASFSLNLSDSDSESNSDCEVFESEDENIRRNFAYLSNNTSSQQVKSNRLRKNKSNNKEASLWWDEDVALNELTSSISSITS